MKYSPQLLCIIASSLVLVLNLRTVLTNPTGAAHTQAIAFKTIKACAHKHNVDFNKLQAAYLKGNFKEIAGDGMCVLECIANDLKFFIKKSPQYETIANFADHLVKGDKSSIRKHIEKCISTTTNDNFCQHLHNALECFYHATKGFGRQEDEKDVDGNQLKN